MELRTAALELAFPLPDTFRQRQQEEDEQGRLEKTRTGEDNVTEAGLEQRKLRSKVQSQNMAERKHRRRQHHWTEA